MKLSIIIINYNTFKMTCDCLRDINKNTWDFDFEVILVDNASAERDPEDFKKEFPSLNLIKISENSGFARGNNSGIAVAKGEYLLILNSDTLNLNQGVSTCVRYMDLRKQEADLAGVGCKILSVDGSRQNSAWDYRIGLKSTLLNNALVSFLASKLGYGKYRQAEYMDAIHEKEHPVQAMLGAFMLVRRAVVEEVKPLDPDFFMYGEETEWCYRINDNGYRLMYIPDAYITHIGGGTSSNLIPNEQTNRQYYLSILLLIFKQNGYWGIFVFNIVFAINYVVNSLQMPFRSTVVKEGHKNWLDGTFYSLKRQGKMLKYFKPVFASSKFPFKLSIVESLN